jgi:uncharacterized membrane protein
MESKAKLFGHAVHPMLIVFPLGLLATSLIFDIIHLSTGNARWADISYWMLASGIIGGLIAAVPGVIDLLHIPRGTRASRIGTCHGVGNILVVALFAVSWLLRRDAPGNPGSLPVFISATAVGLALITAWLGGELVARMGVGVADGAHVNAPSSLSGRPAVDRAAHRGPQVPITTGAVGRVDEPREVELDAPMPRRGVRR